MIAHPERGVEMIQTKRVYDGRSSTDGKRFLVDRLWPRGLKKENLHLDGWLKDIAPTAELRKWFSHDPAKWSEFQKRYRTELTGEEENLQILINAARDGNITLLYGAHDQEHNNAVALKQFLDEKSESHPKQKTQSRKK